MKIARALALLALALTLLPAIAFAMGWLSDSTMKLLLLIGAVLWFAAAPKWLRGGAD